jgi:hypothetical protein
MLQRNEWSSAHQKVHKSKIFPVSDPRTEEDKVGAR